MFTLETYINYLEKHMKISYFSNGNSKYSKQDFLNSLTDFAATSHGKYLGSRPGDQIKSLFPSLSVDKPKSVSYTHWLLFNYGYKYCSNCEQVLETMSFSSNKTIWNRLSPICKNCDNERGAEYKKNHKKQAKAAYDIWYSNNKHIRAAATAKRRAATKQAIPIWLTEEHLAAIVNIYKVAREKGLQVDHIVPLQNNNVCGLHVPWNLQLISSEDNLRKSNKYNDW
jgi:5-methylcytosine-specific restriction endonuclease McrA